MFTCIFITALIRYTGHGVQGSGDWVFNSGTVSFSEIYELYKKYFHGKLLYIVTDCCYSGELVLRLAEYLSSQNIGACGHCTRERGVLIKVFAACLPRETAYDGAYSDKGVSINPTSHDMNFSQATIEVEGKRQTPCFLDTTEVCCYNSPQEKCNWNLIPRDTDWSWSQLANSDHRRSINRLYLVRGKDRGKPAWHYVLVKSHLLKDFCDKVKSGTIDVKDYGHILCKGWGKDPPELLHNKLQKYSPFT